MNRYARQISLPEIGAEGQAHLTAAKVLVAGAGGLGSALLPLLVGAGVGSITLYDPDVVEVHNLHRQTLYRMDDLGQPKAEIAARHLKALNPDCHVQANVARLDPVAAQREIDRADLVIDAADSFAVSYALSDLCQTAVKPLVSASVLGRRGYVGGFCGKSPSLRAVFPDPPAVAANCATDGVMGPAVATLGAMQAQMALSILLHHAPSPLGKVLSVDFATWRISQFSFDGAHEPDEIFPKIIAHGQIEKDDLLVDLRKNDIIDPAQLGPAPDRRVVFLCASGLRAWRAARDLADDSGHRRIVICAVGA
ncbi:ThiF family adenylyltransferase [Celeribacter sp. SCSIO 80788]|uniref:HesA/MoeB/ThiF family protein n=1 Tax=Celeribacter sp. SCSIO 80788 TaxID=3117013 RepID=UPI003DA3900F